MKYNRQAFGAGLALSAILSVGGVNIASHFSEATNTNTENTQETTQEVSQAQMQRPVSFKIV